MSAFDIRPASDGDTALLATLIAQSFADVAEQFGLTRENCPAHTSFIREDDVRIGMGFGSVFYIASAGGCVCGCIAVRRPKSGHSIIEKLAVLPSLRHRGIGRALVETALDDARRSGATAADIGIIADHAELKAWYEGLGFTAVRRTHYDHLPFDVLHLTREVG